MQAIYGAPTINSPAFNKTIIWAIYQISNYENTRINTDEGISVRTEILLLILENAIVVCNLCVWCMYEDRSPTTVQNNHKRFNRK